MTEIQMAARTPAQQLGDAAEGLVGERLAASGGTVLGRNLHFERNEVDLLAAAGRDERLRAS